MSPLDKAYVAVLTDQDKRLDFYRTFLTTEIFVPVQTPDNSDQSQKALAGEPVFPIFIESNGVKRFMLFDSKQRLTHWTQGEVGFIALPGHAVVEMLNAEFYWTLNAATKHIKTFVPDEIKWLKEYVAGTKADGISFPDGTQVLIGAPTPKMAPTALLESLTQSLLRHKEVKQAYLGQVHYQVKGERPHLALAIEVGDTSAAMLGAIRNDLAAAAGGFLAESKYMDIVVAEESNLAELIMKSVSAFYSQH